MGRWCSRFGVSCRPATTRASRDSACIHRSIFSSMNSRWRRLDRRGQTAVAQLILRRLGWMLVTMLAASLLLFLLFELMPGDVALNELGPYSTPEQRHLWLVANGYDRSAIVRYFDW